MITVILALAALCWLAYQVCKQARSETVGFWALIVCVASGALDAVLLSTHVFLSEPLVAIALLAVVAGVGLSAWNRRKAVGPGR
jgi:uncharacterized membrane protein YebE (DUF533 family)